MWFLTLLEKLYLNAKMTTLAIKSELDAAEALLELQRDYRDSKYDQSSDKENSLQMANFLYNFIGSRSSLVGVPAKSSTPKTSPCTKSKRKPDLLSPYGSNNIKHFDKHKSSEDKFRPQRRIYNNDVKSKLPKQEAVITKVWSDNVRENYVKIISPLKTTLDKGTQTEIEYQMPEIEKMESVIKALFTKIKALENRLKSQETASLSLIDSVADHHTDNSNDERSIETEARFNGRRSHKRKRTSTVNTENADYNSNSANTTYKELSNDDSDSDYSISGKLTKPNHTMKIKNEMVSIGDGNAIVPSKLMKNMDWSSYTNATRKLLRAVFSRKVLATHSLTGKPSPAFPDKPAKKKLNSSLVNDIVQTVVEKCHVPESVVRTSITTKCADESKMFRSRQKNKKKCTSNKRNRENIPPCKYEPDDSEISDQSYVSS